MSTPLVILGSTNRDMTVVVGKLPLPGETILGGDVAYGLGGKGANQAAAAARSGTKPVFVSAVGDDDAGHGLLTELEAVGVDASHLLVTPDAPTGVALIIVDANGENSIVVAAGANLALDPTETAATISDLVATGSVVLSQIEIAVAVVEAGARATAERGGRFVLNLSPSQPVAADVLALADPLIVNETEAADLSGLPIGSVDDAEAAATALLERTTSVVVTLGGDGVVFADASGIYFLPSHKVTVVDTTGAGDAFAGALAAQLSQGATLADAVQAGTAAGALAVQHLGAQPRAGF